jgi:hypothetical protein
MCLCLLVVYGCVFGMRLVGVRLCVCVCVCVCGVCVHIHTHNYFTNAHIGAARLAAPRTGVPPPQAHPAVARRHQAAFLFFVSSRSSLSSTLSCRPPCPQPPPHSAQQSLLTTRPACPPCVCMCIYMCTYIFMCVCVCVHVQCLAFKDTKTSNTNTHSLTHSRPSLIFSQQCSAYWKPPLPDK